MTPLVQLDTVSRWYGQGHAQVRALTDISLALPPASQTVLTGPSGSGKTTLLNLIGALDRPTAGTVVIDGETVSTFDERRASEFRRTQVGFIFQDDALLPELTLTENIELPLFLVGLSRQERHARMTELLQRLMLEERRQAYPATLSGGEKQRTAVARAVIHRPRILLADEPTANLDADSATVVLGIMRRLAAQEQLTLLISTHDPRVFNQFEHIIHLSDGRLIPSPLEKK